MVISYMFKLLNKTSVQDIFYLKKKVDGHNYKSAACDFATSMALCLVVSGLLASAAAP